MKEEKVHVTDVIGDDYQSWKNRVVILKAPTGSGKTTFVLKKFVPYFKENDALYGKKKVLILSNRTLLKRQYSYSLPEFFESYQEVVESCDLKTYQELADRIMRMNDVSGLFKNYSAVVCDEAHYFYADSDFASESFKVLWAILYASYGKTILFMSATIDEVKPLITEAWKSIYDIFQTSRYGENWGLILRRDITLRNTNAKREIIVLNNLISENYSRYKCHVANDYEELTKYFVESEFKSLLFIDDIQKAEEFRSMLMSRGLSKKEVAVIHADNINADKTSSVIKNMVAHHFLEPKVLITTSVLDNGISLEDASLRNIAIISNSRLSFIQMLGRIRECDGVDTINLILLKRGATDLSMLLTRYENFVKQIDIIMNNRCGISGLSYKELMDIWTELWSCPDSMRSQVLRKVLIPCTITPCYFNTRRMYRYYYPIGPGMSFVVSLAAVSKIQNSYMEMRALCEAASSGTEKFIRYQMSWIGKENESFNYLNLVSDEEKKAPMKEKLLTIQNFTGDKYREVKKELLQSFKKFYPSLNFRAGDGLPGTEKMESIYEDLGLRLTKVKDQGKERYTVTVADSREESL